MSTVNWESDSWFAKHHASDLTDDFKEWWLKYYGTPEMVPGADDEQHEYWKRCAFALCGWLARDMKTKPRIGDRPNKLRAMARSIDSAAPGDSVGGEKLLYDCADYIEKLQQLFVNAVNENTQLKRLVVSATELAHSITRPDALVGQLGHAANRQLASKFLKLKQETTP